MIFGIAFLGDRLGATDRAWKANRVSAFAAARDAYTFLFRNFWSALRLLLLPVTAVGLVLYVTLSRYLMELASFLDAPDPRVASLALGTLAAGLFLSLFCCAVAVSAISDLAFGKAPTNSWLNFRVERQVWRIYAAFLRVLLLLTVIVVLAFLFSTYIAPLLLIPRSFSPWLFGVGSIFGAAWLVARIAFLVTPIIAVSEGTILRKAMSQSAGDFWRNTFLVVVLLVPGLLLLLAGGYVFGIETTTLRVGSTLPLADSARSMREILAAFLTVICLALFVSIVLLTVGAIAVYQTKRFRHVWNRELEHNQSSSNFDRSVPVERLPK